MAHIEPVKQFNEIKEIAERAMHGLANLYHIIITSHDPELVKQAKDVLNEYGIHIEMMGKDCPHGIRIKAKGGYDA